MACVGFMVEGTFACVLVGGGELFSFRWTELCEVMYFRVSVGCLSADGCACVPVLFIVWFKCPVLWSCILFGGARSWVQVEAFLGVFTD